MRKKIYLNGRCTRKTAKIFTDLRVYYVNPSQCLESADPNAKFLTRFLKSERAAANAATQSEHFIDAVRVQG